MLTVKTVPTYRLLPPYSVVPYRSPFTAIKLALGFAPSLFLVPLLKLYSTFSAPVVLILKTVPAPSLTTLVRRAVEHTVHVDQGRFWLLTIKDLPRELPEAVEE